MTPREQNSARYMARLRAVLRQHWNADRNNAIEVLGRQSDRSWKLIIGDPIGASKKSTDHSKGGQP